MFNPAGSVAVSARATLATTKATSGNSPSPCPVALRISMFCSSEMLGSAMGMNINVAFIERRHELAADSRRKEEAPPKRTTDALDS